MHAACASSSVGRMRARGECASRRTWNSSPWYSPCPPCIARRTRAPSTARSSSARRMRRQRRPGPARQAPRTAERPASAGRQRARSAGPARSRRRRTTWTWHFVKKVPMKPPICLSMLPHALPPLLHTALQPGSKLPISETTVFFSLSLWARFVGVGSFKKASKPEQVESGRWRYRQVRVRAERTPQGMRPPVPAGAPPVCCCSVAPRACGVVLPACTRPASPGPTASSAQAAAAGRGVTRAAERAGCVRRPLRDAHPWRCRSLAR